jgi:hypothetical protein
MNFASTNDFLAIYHKATDNPPLPIAATIGSLGARSLSFA